jgi:hypothetical protein
MAANTTDGLFTAQLVRDINLKQLGNCCLEIGANLMSGAEADEKSEGVEHLVVLVHGINTNAQWFPIIKNSLEAAGFVAVPAGYGIYGVIRFLLPIDLLRRAAISRVYDKIRLARNYYKPKLISVIAHSFGTYVVARIIAENFDIELNRVIFCGSVVRNDFAFQDNRYRFKPPLHNEIGTRDYWPVVASAITWGYGSVGSDGFQNPVVNDRWHKGFRHSDFMTKEFCENFYIPSLRGEAVSGDDPSSFPLWVQIASRLPIKWFLAVLLIAGSVLVTAFVVENAPPLDKLVTNFNQWVKLTPEAPKAPEWRLQPAGTRYTPLDASVMALSEIDGAPLGWEIGRGQVVPASPTGEQWEEAKVKGVEWLRIQTPNGGFAYVQKSRLKPFAD